MKPSEILQRAKDSLTDKTWGKGYPLERPKGTLCAMEAIEEQQSKRVRCFRFLRAATGANTIAQWNDAPERTLAEVHAAFDRAIAAAQEAGQ